MLDRVIRWSIDNYLLVAVAAALLLITGAITALRMPVDVSIAFRLDGKDAAWVYRNIGPDYVRKIIRPASRTAVSPCFTVTMVRP